MTRAPSKMQTAPADAVALRRRDAFGRRLGPFEIAPQQVSLLGHAFTPFVNHLLDRERGRAGVAGHRLRVDSQETADGGVDSQVVGSAQRLGFLRATLLGSSSGATFPRARQRQSSAEQGGHERFSRTEAHIALSLERN